MHTELYFQFSNHVFSELLKPGFSSSDSSCILIANFLLQNFAVLGPQAELHARCCPECAAV